MSAVLRWTFRCLLGSLLLAAGPWASASGQAASNFAIVANLSVPEDNISMDDLRAIFLGTKTSVRNLRLRPVLSAGSGAHDIFLREVLGKTDSSLRIYYRSLVFTGRGQVPKEVDSEAQALSFVRDTPGGITYVSAGQVLSLTDGRLRVIRVH